jgi:prephenate dehydrogenase
MKTILESTVVVVGLGLMGGSLAGALHGKCRKVVGVARRTETINRAVSQGLIDAGTTDIESGLREADIIALATPVRTIIKLVREIGPLLPKGALLIDLGSTKEEIVGNMSALPTHVQPLGGHPMCGKELSGISVADPHLYLGKTFILVPLPRTTPEAVDLGRDLTRTIGATPLVLDDARRHDFLVGTLSHLPYLLACALVQTADATTSEDPAAWEIVASGFRDTSRVAASAVDMMSDIILTNRNEILGALQEYSSHLSELGQLVKDGDEQEIRQALSYAREKRMEMFP